MCNLGHEDDVSGDRRIVVVDTSICEKRGHGDILGYGWKMEGRMGGE